MPIDVSDFIIKPPPVTESAGILHLQDALDKQMQYKYRDQKDKEADQWKKLGLIQDLTDLSKHQTGSDVANAIGNKTASDILQKYTGQIDKMSPMELQANVSRDMSGAIQGMTGIQNELTTADKQIAMVKQENPDLNIAQLAQDARTDILHRRLDNTGNFANPIIVPPSAMNLADPDVLSNYVTGNKNLRNYFQNPQGMDELSVYKGSPNEYTKYTAKVPPYKTPNFDPATLRGGFMTTKDEPQLKFKSSVLPSESLPSSQGQPFEMMDKIVLDNLGVKEKTELVAETKKMFPGSKDVPGYTQMTPTEKEYAQRHVLLQTAKSLDQTNFHPTEVHTPSASLLKLSMGTTGDQSGYHNIYKGLQSDVGDAREKGLSYLTGSALSSEQADLALTAANKKYPELKFNQDNIKVGTDDAGRVQVFYSDAYLAKHPKIDNPLITTLDERESNIKGNQPLGVKAKQKALQEGNQSMQGVNPPPSTTKTNSYKIKGKDYSESELLKMGYSIDEIKPYKK